MVQLTSRLARKFEVVILDMAPALALAEAGVAAAFADTVLLAARWRETPTGATALALRTLNRVGAKVQGLVLTRVD